MHDWIPLRILRFNEFYRIWAPKDFYTEENTFVFDEFWGRELYTFVREVHVLNPGVFPPNPNGFVLMTITNSLIYPYHTKFILPSYSHLLNSNKLLQRKTTGIEITDLNTTEFSYQVFMAQFEMEGSIPFVFENKVLNRPITSFVTLFSENPNHGKSYLEKSPYYLYFVFITPSSFWECNQNCSCVPSSSETSTTTTTSLIECQKQCYNRTRNRYFFMNGDSGELLYTLLRHKHEKPSLSNKK